jgi:hypothetical protein
MSLMIKKNSKFVIMVKKKFIYLIINLGPHAIIWIMFGLNIDIQS